MKDERGGSGSSVLVTGASGFIGSALCAKLVQTGAEVHAVSRSATPELCHGARCWQVDLADSDKTRALLKEVRPDVVYHFAGHAFGSREVELVQPTLRSNLLSTVNLLLAATDLPCRRIVLSGSLEEPDGDAEQIVPSSPYAASKWAATAYGRMFHALYDLPVVIARPFLVYGPGQDDPRKMIPYVICSLLRGESPELGSGARPLDWIYVDDVVDGVLRVADAPGLEGTRVDLGSGQAVTVREVVERITAIIQPKHPPRFGALPDRPHEQVRIGDVEGTARKLAWRPSTSLAEGLSQTVQWHAERLGCGE